MKDSSHASWEDLQLLFSVVMCLDKSMSIVFASKTLRQALPEIDRKPKLKDIFDVVRPSSFSTFSEGYNSIGSLCLLVAQNNTFAIRGQLISMRYSGKDVLCFLRRALALLDSK